MENSLLFQIGFKARERIVVITKGQSPHSSPDYPGWIAVDIQAFAGGFEGTVSDYLSIGHLSMFCTQLEDLYQTLQGTAFLGAIDGRFVVDLTGDGLGHISANFELGDDLATLKFTIEVDQTFMPKMITELKHIIDSYTNS